MQMRTGIPVHWVHALELNDYNSSTSSPLPHLPRGMATVHAQVATSHEAARIAEQEHCGTAVLLWTGQTAQHVLLGPLVAALGELDEQLLDHLGDDVAGGNSVDADVILAPLGGQVAAQLDDGCFAGVVGGADETLKRVVWLVWDGMGKKCGGRLDG